MICSYSAPQSKNENPNMELSALIISHCSSAGDSTGISAVILTLTQQSTSVGQTEHSKSTVDGVALMCEAGDNHSK